MSNDHITPWAVRLADEVSDGLVLEQELREWAQVHIALAALEPDDEAQQLLALDYRLAINELHRRSLFAEVKAFFLPVAS